MSNAQRASIPAALACLIGAAPVHAETAVATYVLEDVWLEPDVSHPGAGAQPLTGTFEWTYEVGDFENGSGAFVEIDLPWWGEGLPALDATIELTSIEIVLTGNWHDLGVDVSLFLLDPLAPDAPSSLDLERSHFEIQRGVSRQGHVILGSVVPASAACPADLDGDGAVGFGDVVAVLSTWGPCAGCPEDVDGDDDVGFSDLLIALGAWGPCP